MTAPASWLRLPARLRAALLVTALVFGCLILGMLVAHGGTPQRVAVGLVCAGAAIVPIASLRFRLLTLWVLLTVSTSPFLRFPNRHPVATFDRVWVLGGCLLFLLATPARPIDDPKVRRLHGAFLAFLTLYAVRIMFSRGAGLHTVGVWLDAVLIPTVLFVVTFRLIRTPGQCAQLARAFAYGGAFLGLLAMVERATGYSLAVKAGGAVFHDPSVGVRVSGSFATPDELALCLLMCFALTLYLVLSDRRHRIRWSLITAIELIGIGLTFFRGAYIGVLLIALISLGVRPKRYERLLGVAAVLLALAGAALFESYGSVSQRIGTTNTVDSRLATYKASLTLFKTSPVFGVGVSSFTIASTAFQSSTATGAVNGYGPIPYAHNSFLLILVEQGVVGLAPLLVLAFMAGATARSLIRRAPGKEDFYFGMAIAASLVGYLVMSMELAEITSSTSNSFVAVILGAAAGRLVAIRDEEEQLAPPAPPAEPAPQSLSRLMPAGSVG